MKCCKFNKNGDYFSSGSDDNIIMVWKSNFSKSNELICPIMNNVNSNENECNYIPSSPSIPTATTTAGISTRGDSSKSCDCGLYCCNEFNIPPVPSPIPFSNTTASKSVNNNNNNKTSEVSVGLNDSLIIDRINKSLESMNSELMAITCALELFNERLSNTEDKVDMLMNLYNKDNKKK